MVTGPRILEILNFYPCNKNVFIFSFQSTNFANPIYEQYYTHKDSRQELLKAEDSDDDEDISKNKV